MQVPCQLFRCNCPDASGKGVGVMRMMGVGRTTEVTGKTILNKNR
jgi:hypothetical protein